RRRADQGVKLVGTTAGSSTGSSAGIPWTGSPGKSLRAWSGSHAPGRDFHVVSRGCPISEQRRRTQFGVLPSMVLLLREAGVQSLLEKALLGSPEVERELGEALAGRLGEVPPDEGGPFASGGALGAAHGRRRLRHQLGWVEHERRAFGHSCLRI